MRLRATRHEKRLAAVGGIAMGFDAEHVSFASKSAHVVATTVIAPRLSLPEPRKVRIGGKLSPLTELDGAAEDLYGGVGDSARPVVYRLGNCTAGAECHLDAAQMGGELYFRQRQTLR
jgi:hypothetical protein